MYFFTVKIHCSIKRSICKLKKSIGIKEMKRELVGPRDNDSENAASVEYTAVVGILTFLTRGGYSQHINTARLGKKENDSFEVQSCNQLSATGYHNEGLGKVSTGAHCPLLVGPGGLTWQSCWEAVVP